MSLQFQRGTNLVRQRILLQPGEPFFVTDYAVFGVAPVWIGNGADFGGVPMLDVSNLDELLDVEVATPQDNQLLQYETDRGRWENRSNVIIPGTLTSTGAATLNQTLTVAGTTTLSGPVTLNQTLAVTGNTTLTGDLAVNGGDITTNVGAGGIANLYNSNAIDTINIGNGVVTEVNIGNSSSGTSRVQIKSPLLTINGNIFQGNQSQNILSGVFTPLNTTNTTFVNLFNFSLEYSSIEFTLNARSGSQRLMQKYLVTHNGSQAVINTIGSAAIGSGSSFFTIAPVITSQLGIVSLRVTPATNTLTSFTGYYTLSKF